MAICKGYIDSIYHGSSLDGDGLRSVIFFSGCNLRCGFCHNPETLYDCGKPFDEDDILNAINRYKNYYKNGGGVTLSGGEPFLQANFCISLCKKLNGLGVNVIAETNGLIINENLMRLLSGIRLDVKNQNGENGITLINRYSAFLNECKRINLPVTLTNVLVPTINDGDYNAKAIKTLLNAYPEYGSIKLLPFHKHCVEKYRKLNIPFVFEEFEPATQNDLKKFYEKLNAVQ